MVLGIPYGFLVVSCCMHAQPHPSHYHVLVYAAIRVSYSHSNLLRPSHISGKAVTEAQTWFDRAVLSGRDAVGLFRGRAHWARRFTNRLRPLRFLRLRPCLTRSCLTVPLTAYMPKCMTHPAVSLFAMSSRWFGEPSTVCYSSDGPRCVPRSIFGDMKRSFQAALIFTFSFLS